MSAFTNSFVSGMTKVAMNKSANVLPYLAGAGGLGFGVHQAMKNRELAAENARLAQSRPGIGRLLAGAGLGVGGLMLANHLGFDGAGMAEKLKGALGFGADAAGSAGAAGADAAAIGPQLPPGLEPAQMAFQKAQMAQGSGILPPGVSPLLTSATPVDQVAPMTPGPSVGQAAASALKNNPVVGQLKSILSGNQPFQGPSLPPNAILPSGNLTTMAPGSDFATANFDTPINYDSSGRAVMPFKDGGYMRSAFNPMPF